MRYEHLVVGTKIGNIGSDRTSLRVCRSTNSCAMVRYNLGHYPTRSQPSECKVYEDEKGAAYEAPR